MMVLSNTQNLDWQQPVRISFDQETGYLVLQLDKDEYGFADRAVRYKNRVFEPKSELHITVLSREAAEAVKAHIEDQPMEGGRVREVVDTTRWSFHKLNEFYHVVEEPGVETIIQMVEVQYLGEFFRNLSGIVQQGFHLPPTHVTLYTRGTEKGIGLPTHETFNQLVKGPVQPGEVTPLANNRQRSPGQAGGVDQGLA